MITMIKVIFGFLFICLMGGLFFYTIFDLKPWRKDSMLWDSEKGPAPVFLKVKKIAQQNLFNKHTTKHIKSYYMYYGLVLLVVALIVSQ